MVRGYVGTPWETTRVEAMCRRCRLGLSYAIFLAIGMWQATAHGRAPMATGDPPGFYRTIIGSLEVTSLSDGTIALPVDQLLQAPVEHIDALLARSYLQSPLDVSVNAFVINTRKKLILIDTGAGGLFGPTLGKLVTNLRHSGYRPDQIDDIYLTHLHPDHVGGLVKDGKPVFSRATVHANRKELEFWLSEERLRAAKDGDKPYFRGAMSAIKPYARAHRLVAFDGDRELEAGLFSVATPGHTVGHTSFVLRSMGQTLLICGDLVHVAEVQMPEPSIAIAFDGDGPLAVATRLRVLDGAARQGYWIAAAHLPFPGLGHVRNAEEGFRFVPANYQSLH